MEGKGKHKELPLRINEKALPTQTSDQQMHQSVVEHEKSSVMYHARGGNCLHQAVPPRKHH